MFKKNGFWVNSLVVLKEIYLYYLDLLSWFVVVLIFFLNDEKLGIEIIFVWGGYNNFFYDWVFFVMFYNNIINY